MHRDDPMAEHEYGHRHQHSAAGRALGIALILTLGFSVVELIAGWHAGSLALMADAGHMVSDGAARLALSARVRLADLSNWPQILAELSKIAAHQGIEHVTFQPEPIRSIRAEPVNFIRR